MFKISDKVVCIWDDWTSEQCACHSSMPVKGSVYVVQETGLWNGLIYYIRLVGIDDISGACGFQSICFRKLEEVQAENGMKALVSIAKQMDARISREAEEKTG